MSRRKQYRPVRVQEEDDKINDDISSENSKVNSGVVKSIASPPNDAPARVSARASKDDVAASDDGGGTTAAAATKPQSSDPNSNDDGRLESSHDDDPSKVSLAMLQSTFLALQQQQLQQMHLIQQLQSQLESDEGSSKDEPKDAPEPQKLNIMNPSEIIDPDMSDSEAANPLELLQKRTQEVLDNASHSMNGGNMAEELAYQKNQTKEPFFKHRCKYCGKIFGSDSALQIHLRSHTGERPFKCNMCSSSFTTKGNLKVHYQRHTQPNYPTPAPPHPRLFPPFAFALRSHQELKRRREEEELLRSESPEEKVEELKPKIKSPSPKQIVKVEEPPVASPKSEPKTVEKKVLFPIPKFGTRDKSWENFIEVTKTSETSKLQQLVDNIENKLNDPNECPVCHKVLSCKSSLLMHYRIHTGEKPFRCKLCGRPFTTKGNLKVHMSIHQVKEPFAGFDACPICHKKYPNILELQQHIRSHSEDQPVSPTSTDFASSTSETESEGALDLTPPSKGKKTSRILSISSQDTFASAPASDDGNDQQSAEHVAPATAADEAQLLQPMMENNHNQGNSIGGNVMCSLCGNDEQSKTECFCEKAVNLSKKVPEPMEVDSPEPEQLIERTVIERKVHDEKEEPVNTKHYCKICKKNFSSSSALQIHNRTHTGDRPFVCHVCSKSFTTKGNLKVHMGTHMWTNGASRRGRRMSLELPRPPDFIQGRPDLFYPFLPQFMPRGPFLMSPSPSPGKFPFGPPPFSLLPLHRPMIESMQDENSNSSVEDLSERRERVA